MKQSLLFPTLALLAGCTQQAGEIAPAEVSQSGESRLAAELADYRQTGEALSCVNSRDLQGNRSVGEEAIIFEGTGRRIYVNRPAAGCPTLGLGRALRIRTPSTRFCRGDIVNVFDPVSGIDYGSCSLGDFTPYERNPR